VQRDKQGEVNIAEKLPRRASDSTSQAQFSRERPVGSSSRRSRNRRGAAEDVIPNGEVLKCRLELTGHGKLPV
jgi:hypothetical protein